MFYIHYTLQSPVCTISFYKDVKKKSCLLLDLSSYNIILQYFYMEKAADCNCYLTFIFAVVFYEKKTDQDILLCYT